MSRGSDAINQIIEQFEDELSQIGIGLVYWQGADTVDWASHLIAADDRERVTLEDRSEAESASGWLIGYAKTEGKWKLVAKQVQLLWRHDGHGGAWDHHGATTPIALTKAPRIVRIDAVGKLENFATALTRRLEKYAEDVEAAKSMVLQLADDDSSAAEARYDGFRDVAKLPPGKCRGGPLRRTQSENGTLAWGRLVTRGRGGRVCSVYSHTLLDETVVFFGSELQSPPNRTKDNMPFLLAGGGGGLRGGRWLRYGGRPHNDLLVSILNLFGDERQTFGDGEFVTGPLSKLV